MVVDVLSFSRDTTTAEPRSPGTFNVVRHMATTGKACAIRAFSGFAIASSP